MKVEAPKRVVENAVSLIGDAVRVASQSPSVSVVCIQRSAVK